MTASGGATTASLKVLEAPPVLGAALLGLDHPGCERSREGSPQAALTDASLDHRLGRGEAGVTMAKIVLDGVTKVFGNEVGGRRRRVARDRRRRVHGAGRPLRVRQVDARCGSSRVWRRSTAGEVFIGERQVTDLRPARPATSRWCSRTTRCTRTLTVRAEPRLRPQAAQDTGGRTRSVASHDVAHILGLDGAARTQAGRALRRSAPARRDGARDGSRAGGVPDGRAVVEPRRQAAGQMRAQLARLHERLGDRPRSTSPTTRSRR